MAPPSSSPFFASLRRVRPPVAGAHSTPTAAPPTKASTKPTTERPVLAIIAALLDREVYRSRVAPPARPLLRLQRLGEAHPRGVPRRQVAGHLRDGDEQQR